MLGDRYSSTSIRGRSSHLKLEPRHHAIFKFLLNFSFSSFSPPPLHQSPLACNHTFDISIALRSRLAQERAGYQGLSYLTFVRPSRTATMASITAILSFLIMARTALAAMMPINQGCATSSPSVKVLTYVQWTAPQIGKTSTVYDMIVTHYDYVSSSHLQDRRLAHTSIRSSGAAMAVPPSPMSHLLLLPQ